MPITKVGFGLFGERREHCCVKGILRNWKVAFIRKLISGKRGKRISSEMLLANVTSMTMKFDDHFMSFSPNEYIGRSIFLSGDFDRKLADELVAFLSRRGYLPGSGATVLEIGANIGTQTVYFCRSGKVAKVIAVEPDPRNLSLIRRNVALSRLSPLPLVQSEMRSP